MKTLNVIEPHKTIIEDLEILAFEDEKQLNYYTVWHEALYDKRRELAATSEREKQIIRAEINRKTSLLIGESASTSTTKKERPTKTKVDVVAPPNAKSNLRCGRGGDRRPDNNIPLARIERPLPHGLVILNSSYYNTMPDNKVIMKYKLTKLYNKLRGRQMRRNFVIEKQRNIRIEAEIAKSYLNSWLTYTALQALKLPENNLNQLNAATTHNSKILTPMMAQPTAIFEAGGGQPIYETINNPTMLSPSTNSSGKKTKPPAKKFKGQSQAPNPKAPMHLVYIDPGNIITYSNRINPQQIIEYKNKPPIQASSATSKKSSAASYDVYEIMEVLANTNKTNVTITRNANIKNKIVHPGANATSIYSHSVNSNTPGIVSTQLHLQARSYLDSMSKFYAEERERLEKEMEAFQNEPSIDETIGKYLKI